MILSKSRVPSTTRAPRAAGEVSPARGLLWQQLRCMQGQQAFAHLRPANARNTTRHCRLEMGRKSPTWKSFWGRCWGLVHGTFRWRVPKQRSQAECMSVAVPIIRGTGILQTAYCTFTIAASVTTRGPSRCCSSSAMQTATTCVRQSSWRMHTSTTESTTRCGAYLGPGTPFEGVGFDQATLRWQQRVADL